MLYYIYPLSLLSSGIILSFVPYFVRRRLIYLASTLASSVSISFSLQLLLEISPVFRQYLQMISLFNIKIGHNYINAIGFIIPLIITVYFALKSEVDRIDLIIITAGLAISGLAIVLFKMGLIPYLPELLVFRNKVGYSPDLFLIFVYSYSLSRKENPCKLAYIEMFIAGAFGDMVSFLLSNSSIIAGGLGVFDGDFLLPLIFSLELRLLRRFRGKRLI